MEYKISNICSDLGIGKSTIYNRINIIKDTFPESDWKDYFYYNDNKKLFFTKKGFDFIKNNSTNNNIRQDSTKNNVTIYQEQIINIYKERIEYLEVENRRLLDIISIKEQKELAKDVKVLSTNENMSFFDKLFNKFKKD